MMIGFKLGKKKNMAKIKKTHRNKWTKNPFIHCFEPEKKDLMMSERKQCQWLTFNFFGFFFGPKLVKFDSYNFYFSMNALGQEKTVNSKERKHYF